MWLVRKALYEYMVCLAVEWFVRKTLFKPSGWFVRHTINGVAYSLDTLRTRDVSGGLAIVSNLFHGQECLVHKTLY